MAMKRLNIGKVARFLDRPGGAPIRFPNDDRIVAGWIEGDQWEDVEGLASYAWQQIDLPALSSKKVIVL